MQYVPLWTSILDSPKLMKLGPESFRFWALCLVATQKWDFVDGELPDLERLAHWLRMTEDECRERLAALEVAGLVDPADGGWRIHDWNDWRNVKDPQSTLRKRKSREAKKSGPKADGVTESVTENGAVTDMSRPGHASVTDMSRTGHADVPPNPNPNPNPNPSTQAPRTHARPRTHEAPPEVIPLAPKPEPEWEPQPLPDESMTGRSGRDHADFVRAVQILDSHHSTRRLGAELRMSCDTPGVRMLQGWQFVCGAFNVQRPDRNRSWGALTGFARASTQAEFDKLNSQAPARASPAASLPVKTDEELRAQTDEGNRKVAAYRKRMGL